jgi:hypothetical protein
MSPLGSRREIHPAPAPQIAALSFLIGHLRGEGWLGDPSYRYTKEVTGSWVAGGHHVLLAMSADYPLRDNECDHHSVVMIVSAGPDAGSLVSRVYHDGGGMFDYDPTPTPEGLAFDDRVPHGSQATRARKLLRSRSFGYEETLELDYGDGAFVPYSNIELHRSGAKTGSTTSEVWTAQSR